jgi:hypothetical protein
MIAEDVKNIEVIKQVANGWDIKIKENSGVWATQQRLLAMLN